METVSAFIPVDRRHALIRRRPLPDRTGGAVLFADISGFTHLTDLLSQELGSQRGAEEISVQLDRIYSVMIAPVHDYAGSVISFSGDAITCWFDDQPVGASSRHNGAIRATACALAIQSVIQKLGEVRTPEGQTVAVRIKVAVAAGVARRFLLGEPGEQRFEILAGNLVDRSAAAEQLLHPGEIAVGSEIVGHFGSALSISEWRSSTTDEHFAIVSAITMQVPPSPWTAIPEIDATVASGWMLEPVYKRLQSIEGRFLAELRPVVTFFLSFSGINYERDDDAGQKLYEYISWIQTILARYEGYLVQLIIGDKGSYCFIVFGALHAHENDPVRAITTAFALNSLPAELAFITDIHIGISHGVLHVGAYGSQTRRTFGVIGNETNVAARLMSMAQPGEILVTSKVARSAAQDFEFHELGRLQIKGLAQRVSIQAVKNKRRHDRSLFDKASSTSRIVGRDAEMAHLLQKFQLLQAGQSSSLVVEGDAGIGKSRVLMSFLDEVRHTGAAVLLGAGDAIEQATPYFAWRPIFRAIFNVEDTDSAETVREKVVQSLPDDDAIHELLPLLNTVLPLRLPDNDLTAQMTGEARANSTRNLLIKVLSILALSRGSSVLAFDDAHWFDSASAALLSQARRVLSPVLFLIVTRPGALGEAGQTEYARLIAAPDVERLTLGTLSREQVVNLVCHRLGVSDLPASVASFIYNHSEGHPFFSEEIAFALRDAGYVRVEDGRCLLTNGDNDLRNLDFPVTIQGVVTSRIDRLESSQQLTLKVASVLGRIFAVHILHSIYPSAAAADQLPSQLSTLERLDIILPETPPPDLSYMFKHNITQEVVYNLMTFSQRQQLHRNAAQWYETRYAGDLSPYFPLLAHHWSRAEDTRRAIHYLDRAGGQALRNFANEEAINFFSQALSMDAAGGFVSDTQQRALWEIKLGEAFVHWTRYAEGRVHLERGLALLGLPTPYTNSSLRNARHLLAAMLRQGAHRVRSPRYPDSRAADRNVLLAASRAYSRLVEVYFHSGETLRSIHAAFHTLNLAELAGDSPELAEAYAPIAAFFSFLRLYSVANAYFTRALDVATHVNSLPARSFVLLTKSTYETGIGRWTEAQRSIAELIESGQRLGAQRRYNDGLQLRTILLYTMGDFPSCLEVGEKLLISARQLNDLRFQGYGLFACAFAHFHLGDVDAAATHLQELQSLLTARNGVTDTQLALNSYGLWCLIHLTQGNLQQALDAADSAAQLAEGPFQVSYWTLPGYTGPAEAYLSAWEMNDERPDLPQRAADAVKTLGRFARTFPIGRPSARLYQGWRHHLGRKNRRASRAWQNGLQLAREIRLPYEAGRLSYELARTTQDLDDPQRQQHLLQARANFEALGAVHGLHAVQSAIALDRRHSPPLFTSASRD